MNGEDLKAIGHHHGFTVMAHKAMLYDQGIEKLKDKEVKKLPKVTMKPKGRTSPRAQEDGRIGGLRTALKKTGSPEAFVAWAKARNQRNQRRQ